MARRQGDFAGAQPSIVEAFIQFRREISVVAARGHDGRIECFDVTENEHRDHILKISRVPAEVTETLAAETRRIAGRIAEAFAYVGVLAVEIAGMSGWRTRPKAESAAEMAG